MAFDEFHDEVREPAVLALVQNAHHVGVGEPGGSFGFASQPVQELRIVGQVGVQHF